MRNVWIILTLGLTVVLSGERVSFLESKLATATVAAVVLLVVVEGEHGNLSPRIAHSLLCVCVCVSV